MKEIIEQGVDIGEDQSENTLSNHHKDEYHLKVDEDETTNMLTVASSANFARSSFRCSLRKTTSMASLTVII